MAAVVMLFLGFSATAPSSQTTPLVQPGGHFGFSYPSFTSVQSARDFATMFAGAMANPGSYPVWGSYGVDIRQLNPGGAYLKHINIRTIDSTQESSSIEGRPPYSWIKQNHPETLTPNTATATTRVDLPQSKVVTVAVAAMDSSGNVSTKSTTVTR
jgi:hypothetical protein